MRPRIAMVLAALLIGAAVNVIVGVRLANTVLSGHVATTLGPDEAQRLWTRYTGAPPRTERLGCRRNDFSGVRHITLIEQGDPMGDIWDECIVRQFGWPYLAFEGVEHATFDTYTQTQTVREEGVIALPRRLGSTFGYRRLYYGPMWPGLIANSAVYAGAAWLALLSIAAVRRRDRLDQRMCPRCTYDLHAARRDAEADVVCPECGTHVARSRLERPRQLLRGWMVPLLLPLVLSAAYGFLTTMPLGALRFHLRYVEPIVHPVAIISIAAAIAWLYLIGVSAYADRSSGSRRVISLLMAVALGTCAYGSTFALVVWLGWM